VNTIPTSSIPSRNVSVGRTLFHITAGKSRDVNSIRGQRQQWEPNRADPIVADRPLLLRSVAFVV
jgi:hypothetical protein